jgi:hypothetical protein
MSELENELAARVEQLERKIEQLTRPKAPLDLKGGASGPTTTQIALNNLRMSPQAQADHVAAVPSGVVRDVVGDGPVGKLAPAGAENVRRAAPEFVNRSGWRTAQPLSNPEGVALADKLVDAQDARDRADLIAGEARRRLMK